MALEVMTNVTRMPGAPAPGSTLDYALRYAAIGWHVFPVWGAKDGKCRCGRECKSPGKHPVERMVPNGQHGATTDPEIIRRWYQMMPEAGVAVFLQPSHLVAVDIDPRNGGLDSIDDIEAKHGPLMADVLQYTQNGGEHRFFALSSDISLPGKLGAGVDLKRNGYVVLAPTQGVYGKYDWEASSDPLDGAIPSPLPDWVRDLGNRPLPEVSPDDSAPRFVTREQVIELRSALAAIPSDDRDLWVRIGMALFSIGQAGFSLWDEWSRTSAKFDPVDLMRVWRSFKPGSVNYESVFFEAQAHGWMNPLAGFVPMPEAVPAASVKPVQPPSVENAPPPAEMLKPPGMLGILTEWINDTARKPQPQFAVQAAIAVCATIMGRRFVTDQRNWPSLYLLNIGKSASGKEHGKWAAEHLLDACNLSHLIGPAGYTSNSGLLSALHRQPSHLSIIDEFGKTLEAASIKHSARAASAMTAIMEAWGRCDNTLRPQGYSTFGLSAKDAERTEARCVRNPALSLLAMTTPETFFDTIGSASARDGFLNRFLIVETEIGRQAGRHVAETPVPGAFLDWAAKIHAQAGMASAEMPADLAATPKTVRIDKSARALFSAFERECLDLMDAHDEMGLAEMFGRCNETAMRLSLIVAVGCGWSAVSEEHARWAIDYVRHHSLRTVSKLESCVADSEFEAIKKQVLAMIRKAAEKGMTERELNKGSRRFAAIDQRGQLNVLNSLAFAGDISRVEFPSVSGRGASRKAWMAIDGDNPPT